MFGYVPEVKKSEMCGASGRPNTCALLGHLALALRRRASDLLTSISMLGGMTKKCWGLKGKFEIGGYGIPELTKSSAREVAKAAQLGPPRRATPAGCAVGRRAADTPEQGAFPLPAAFHVQNYVLTTVVIDKIDDPGPGPLNGRRGRPGP